MVHPEHITGLRELTQPVASVGSNGALSASKQRGIVGAIIVIASGGRLDVAATDSQHLIRLYSANRRLSWIYKVDCVRRHRVTRSLRMNATESHFRVMVIDHAHPEIPSK